MPVCWIAKENSDMRRAWMLIFLLGGCVSTTGPTLSGARPHGADPAFLEQYALTRRFSAGVPNSIKLTPDGSAVLFLRSPARSNVQDLYEFNTRTGEERVLLTADQILRGGEENLSVEERARRERLRISARGIASYQLSRDGTKNLVPLSGRLFVIERQSAAVKELESKHGVPLDPRFSPDGRYLACVRDDELYVTELATGVEVRLTNDAGPAVSNGLAEFVAQEEMDRREGYWWSPDSTSLVYQQTSTAGMEVMYIADAAHPERGPQSWPYPRPGKPNADVRLGRVSVTGGDTKWIDWDKTRYPYLATVVWKDQAPLTLLVQNRTQTEQALLTVDRDAVASSPLLVEKDDAWINLDQSMPKWFPDGSAFLWTTERNGAWQLELRARDGRLLQTLTTTAFGYKGFVDLDAERKVVHLLGADNPTQTQLYRLTFTQERPSMERVTTDAGVHSATFSENHRVHVHGLSTPDGRRCQEVRDADGRVAGQLRYVAEQPPWVPNLEFTTVGKTPEFSAVLVRPRNFEARRRYPVIVYVYGGPHGQMVNASSWAYLLQQWIADHGFIVVALDGRGTPNRGRAWERALKGNLIDVPLADQVAGLKALGEKYRELDLDRVGIYGWSFGGYFSAMAIMQRPDVYDVAVAGAPVADWLDYDTHYTERYMGLPQDNAKGYQAASVLTYAPKLDKPLLIIHGTADDNVYFAHSLKMSDALFRAGRAHEFLALSDFTHMVADPLVTSRLYQRVVGYFVAHLKP